MSHYFDHILDEAIDTISENIDKKWPHIIKVLKAAITDMGPDLTARNVRRELLSGYTHAIRQEIKNDKIKEKLVQKFGNNLAHIAVDGVATAAKKEGIPREHRIPTRLEYINEYFKQYLVEADPVARASRGRKTPFVNHIVRWLLNASAIFPDDINTIHEVLQQYQKLKHNMGAEVPDLAKMDNPNDLRALIMNYKEGGAYGDLTSKKLPDIIEGIEVYRLDTFEEARDVLCDSGWCVRDEEMFEQYEPPLYLFVAKTGGSYKRLALLSMETGEFMDVYNRPIPAAEMAKFAPIFDYLLGEGSDQERFAEKGWTAGQERPHLSQDLALTLAPILHLVPSAVERLSPESLSEVATWLWRPTRSHYEYFRETGEEMQPLVDRWPKFMEDKLKERPAAFYDYVESVAPDKRIPDLEEELVELAFVWFDKDLEHIVNLFDYYGKREDLFDGGWPVLEELLAELKKYDLDKQFLSTLRYATKSGVRAFLSLAGKEWLSGSQNQVQRAQRQAERNSASSTQEIF